MSRLAQEHNAGVANPFDQGVILGRISLQGNRALTDDTRRICLRRRRLRIRSRRPHACSKQSLDLLVGRRRELLVPESNGVERLRHRDTDDLVSHSSQSLAGLTRPDWHGDNDARRGMLPQRQDRRLHRRAGREPIINEDDRPIANDSRAATASVQRVAPFQLETFAHGDLFDESVRNPQIPNQVAAQDLDAAGGDRPHRELRMTGPAEFPNEKDVERGFESPRDFVSDRDAASRKPEHDHVRAICVLG